MHTHAQIVVDMLINKLACLYIERGEVIDDEAAMLAALDRELGIEAPDPKKRA